MKKIFFEIKTICLSVIVGFLLDINFCNAQTEDSLAIPANVRITNLSSTSAQVLWDTVEGATDYIIRFHQVGSNSWRRETSVNTIETLSSLLPNTSYEVKIKSRRDTTEGIYSTPLGFITYISSGCNPPDPYYFTSNNTKATSCLIGWKKTSAAISYNILYRIKKTNEVWLSASSLSNSFLLIDLKPNSNYEFKIQTVCSNGMGEFSTTGIFTTKKMLCSSPDVISVTDITETSATPIWNEVDCAQHYIIKFRQQGAAWNIDTISLSHYEMNNLVPGTTYDFKIQSVDVNNNISDFSPTFTFTTNQFTSCNTPQNISSTNISTDGATIEWNSDSIAINYNVRYRIKDSIAWTNISITTNEASLENLAAQTQYEYQVQAVCPLSAGNYSSILSFTTLSEPGSNIPVPDHIVICILENKAYSQIIGNASASHINELANDDMSTVFNKSFGIGHPSQPSYLYLFSGDNQGVTNDNLPSQHFTTPNLARELINSGKTFIEYSEGLPSTGYDGNTSGRYARKHNPLANWVGNGVNQLPLELNKSFSSFPTNFDSLPTVCIVSPDMYNSMHNGSVNTAISTGDTWIYNNLFPYIQWAKTHNSLFILTTDEDDGAHINQILTIFTGSMVMHKTNSQVINHFNILRTIEEMYNLNFIGESANVSSIHDCWTSGFRVAGKNIFQTEKQLPNANDWKVYPNPATNELNITYSLNSEVPVSMFIINDVGVVVHKEDLGVLKDGLYKYSIPLFSNLFSNGMYFLEINYGNEKYTRKFQIIR